MLTVKDLVYTYGADSNQAVQAIDGISFSLTDGELVGLVGHTGSGKSTLAQLLCGLLKADGGEIQLDGLVISDKKQLKAKDLAQRIGMVFQYPEYQLFEETVQAELAYGPGNLGWSQGRIEQNIARIAADFRFDLEFLQRNPLALSGGEKRKVALASVLVMNPKLLILDEPFVGLDCVTKNEFTELLLHWQKQHQATVICISHDMDQLAAVCQRLLVLAHGRLVLDKPIGAAFAETEILAAAGILQPLPRQLLLALSKAGWDIDTAPITVEAAARAVVSALGKAGGANG